MPLPLRAAVDVYGNTAALLDERLHSPYLHLTFASVKPINHAFAPMIAERVFDVSEMALATLLQAHALGKPIALLPVVLMNRFHHGSIVRAVGSAVRTPADLVGTCVGVRSYAQTTAVWVRAILQHEYGVAPEQLRWIVSQHGHLAELDDPPNVTLQPDADFPRLLRDGTIDAWIGGRDAAGVPGLEPLLPDAESAARTAFSRDGLLPVNHVLAVRRELLEAEPWVAAELVALFEAAKELHVHRLRRFGAHTADEAFQLELLQRRVDPLPIGVEALRPAVAAMARFVGEQGLVPVPVDVDAVFAPYQRAVQRELAGAAPISAPERED